MSLQNSLRAGFAGALALNVIHEAARKFLPLAPHVDEIAMRAIDKTLKPQVNLSRPKLRGFAFIGDIISNTLYYAAIRKVSKSIGNGSNRSLWKWAAVFGIGAGLGAVLLPPKMGLGQQPTKNLPVTSSLTVLWYLTGALVAAEVFKKQT